MYTWGEGDHGRLGHGDSNGRHVPTLVKDLTDVGSVACGSSHTLAVSKDGRTVWSFGSGENGRLGHGTISNVYRPKIIDGLQGLLIQKVCAGGVFSLALSTLGQVSIAHTKLSYNLKYSRSRRRFVFSITYLNFSEQMYSGSQIGKGN